MTAPLNRIDRLFRHNAETIPDTVHLVCPDGRMQTYGETFARAQRIAATLVNSGVRHGDRVLSFMTNSREMMELFIASSLAGAITVPVNTLTTARELIATAADCGPVAAFIQHQFLDRMTLEFLSRDLRLKVVTQGVAEGWQNYDALVERETPLARSVSDDPEDAGIIIYSSGTTGKPKGVLLRQRCMTEDAHATNLVLRYRWDDVWLTLTPSYSAFGFCYDFLIPAQLGARVVLMPKFDPVKAVDLIERHRVTTLAGVPTMFARIFELGNVKNRNVSSMRLIDVGGGPVSDRLKQDLRQIHHIEVAESYGLSEVTFVSSVQIPYGKHKVGSCGRPLPGFEVRVVDENDQEAPINTPGELCFRSTTFMIGYWNKPELTAQTLRGGWLHTGDIGLVDEDGEIHVVDRLKDMIVSNGNNVFPKEVENALCEHDVVQSAAVIGIPDEISGELIHAFVVLKPGEQVDESDLIAHCKELIGKHKLPRTIAFVTDLPFTASGKIQRFQLREMAKRQRAGA
ncbi:MAG: class I adenylate-forming enzyme family protein [Roseiarcus sp.]|jgi:acyl-CoA synthetase (AMP-forming)/AMP-acid ligase II